MTKRTMSSEQIMLANEGVTDSGRRRHPIINASADPAVYFIRTIGAEFLKIGTVLRADTIQQRMALVQTGCPYELHLEMLIPGAGRHDERRLHKVFDKSRVRAEWFRIEGVIQEVIVLSKVDHAAAIEQLRALIDR